MQILGAQSLLGGGIERRGASPRLSAGPKDQMNHVIRTMVLLGFAAVALAACAKLQGASRSSAPEIPFENVGACPFECCTYRAWTASEATDLRVIALLRHHLSHLSGETTL